jgi:RNA polymerase sigma-70 factor (ECF subfamily)
VAVNTALLYNRRTSHYKKTKSSGIGNEVLSFTHPAEEMIEKERRFEQLGKSISLLEKQDRLIISLILEGLSYEQVAEIVGITTNYVGVKVSRIKKQLYLLLKKHENE